MLLDAAAVIHQNVELLSQKIQTSGFD